MRRRAISIGSVVVAVVALLVVLANATLIDRRAPGIAAVTLSAPVPGQANTAQTLTAIDLQFSEPVRTASVEARFRIEPYVAGSIAWDGSTATFTPSRRLPPDTGFTVSVEPGFEDMAGNVAAAGLDGFTFRTQGPPTVVGSDPADGSEGVAVNAPMRITFDRLMDTTAAQEAVSVDPPATMRPTWSGPALTLAFDPLLFGTTYTVTVGTTAADTDGSRLVAPFTTSFTTVAAGLEVRETLPADGAAGTSVGTPIAVVFDGPIDPDTVEGALQITPPIGGDVSVVPLPTDETPPGPGAPSSSGSVLLFRPSAPLSPHTTYSLSLAPTVAREGAPDQVAPGRAWSFTTGQPTASAHNQVAFLSDRGGIRDVWLMNPDGSAPRQVTAGLAPVSGFDVTADGSRLVYASGGAIRLMATDGSEESVLTSDGVLEYAPRFSPDERSLLLARRDATGADLGWWLAPLEDGAGEERQLLTTGAPSLGSTALPADGLQPGEGLPVWSARSAWDPTGRWLLLTTAPGDVVLLDTTAPDPGTGVTATGLASQAGGAWSPAGSRFVIVAREAAGTTEGLYTIDVDGTVRRRLDAVGSVATAEDGSVVFLVRDSAGGTHVAVGGVEGDRQPQPLTSSADMWDRWPSFSPDGRAILFGRVLSEDPTASAGIWTVNPAGGAAVALTTDGAYPRWLP